MSDAVGWLGADNFSMNALTAPSVVQYEHCSVRCNHNRLMPILYMAICLY